MVATFSITHVHHIDVYTTGMFMLPLLALLLDAIVIPQVAAPAASWPFADLPPFDTGDTMLILLATMVAVVAPVLAHAAKLRAPRSAVSRRASGGHQRMATA